MDNSSDSAFSHVLQQAGVLKNFSVAKSFSQKEISDLKQAIRAVADNHDEYDKLYKEEMAKLANMHDPKNPFPGIIYLESQTKKAHSIREKAKKIADSMSNLKLSKLELCFLIHRIIAVLKLTQEDFLKLNDEGLTDPETDDSGNQ